MIVEDARFCLQEIVGKKLLYIDRCCELVNIGFGDLIERENRNNEIYFVGSSVFHVLSPFRIMQNNSIILGSSDLYISNSQNNLNVDLGKTDSCRLDSILNKQKNFLKNEYVESININEFGDLVIDLQNLTISIFNTNSNDDEAWRFFHPNTEKQHLVVYGDSIKFI